MLKITAALCAASVALYAPAASAADYLRYTFTGNVQQSYVTFNDPGVPSFAQLSGSGTFVYILPTGELAQPFTSADADSTTFRQENPFGYFAGESTEIKASAGRLSISEVGEDFTGNPIRNQIALTGINGSFGTGFPSAEGSYSLLDGSVYFYNQPYRGNFQQEIKGSIDSLRIEQISGDRLSIGLQSVAVVPEPATWALMLAGFGMMAYALRRRPRLSYAV